MATVEFKYGFPLFCSSCASDSLLKLDRNRVSDLWALLDYIIKQFVKHKNSDIKKFLLSLHEQAKYFYQAAESAPVKSQPLLYYYSFLNLAKVFLCITRGTSPDDEYMHSIETDVKRDTTIQTAEVKILTLYSSTRISVAYSLMSALGDSLPFMSPTKLQLKDCLASCIGIHRTFCETYDKSESFVRLLNPHCVKEGKTFEFVATLKKCDAAMMGALVAAGYDIQDMGGHFEYHQRIVMPGYNIRRQDWYDLSSLLSNGLRAYTDGNEYRMYFPLSPKVAISSTSVIYAIMFFLGSVTRYNPYFFDSLMNEKEQWLISEFLNTQPSQFLYFLISYMVGKPICRSRTASI